MNNVIDIMKKCNIKKVLEYVLYGCSGNTYSKMLYRYYSVYCHFLDLWPKYDAEKLIITGYKEYKLGDEKNNFFFTTSDIRKEKITKDVLLMWEEIISENVEVFVPDYFLDIVGQNMLAAEVLLQVEKIYLSIN